MKKGMLTVFIAFYLFAILTGCGSSSEKVLEMALIAIQETDDMVRKQKHTAQAVMLEQTEDARAFIELTNVAQTEEVIRTEQAKEALQLTETIAAQTTAESIAGTQTAIPRNCLPGGSFSDLPEDIETGYLDILRVDTFLEGEELTAVIYFRDYPEFITVNAWRGKDGYSNPFDYAWKVLIDIDNDPTTGEYSGREKGIEYQLYFSRNSQEEEPRTVPFEEIETLFSSAKVWEIGGRYYEDASAAFNFDERSLTLRGEVPGINKNSRLYFYTNNWRFVDSLCEPTGNSRIVQMPQITKTSVKETELAEMVAKTEQAMVVNETEQIFAAQTKTVAALSYEQTQTAIPRQCTPGGTYVDFEGDASEDMVDILKIETSLKGENLTVVMHVKSLPPEIMINTEEDGQVEIELGVNIDVDNDPSTGANRRYYVGGVGNGVEYSLSLFHFSQGDEQTGPIEQVMEHDARVWKFTEKGISSISDGTMSIDYQANSVTISGRVPGINENSRLFFVTNLKHTDVDTLCE